MNLGESNIERFKIGQFSPTPEEEEKAKKEGKTDELKGKMTQATERIHEKVREKANEQLAKELEKAAKEKEDKKEN